MSVEVKAYCPLMVRQAVTAGMIEAAGVEIMNPDHVLNM